MAQLKQVCTVTNGSQTVAVIGVNVAYRILANSIFMTSPDFVPYTVARDAQFDGTNTVVTLAAEYQGDSGAMAQGVFVTDFTYPDNIPLISQGDVGTAAIWTKAMYTLQAMIGSVTPAGLNAFIAQINQTQAAADADAAAALASQNAAKTSETNAKTSETSAAASQSAAATSATNAKTSETNAKTSETNSAASASASAGSATASSNSATAAAGSASAASTSASNASGSASAAAASKTAAGTSEANAKTSETNAAGSAAAALASQDAAKTSETNSKTSETNAKTSETNAKTSETNAKTSETNAAASATNAAVDRATVQGILTTMNALYLGNKASDPTVDNSGNALKQGAEYFNTTTQLLRVYTSTGWQNYDKDAQTQATNATASAAAAAGSASGAATSATNAHTSETNAAASAAAALASQNAAKTSETNAKTSETNAKSSETNAQTSESNAKTSETNAAASAAHADQVAQTIGNPVSKNGDTMTGQLGIAYAGATEILNDTSGSTQFGYGYQSGGTPLWAMWVATSKNWLLQRYANGVAVDNPISVSGSTGVVSMPSRVLVGAGADDGSNSLQVGGSMRADNYYMLAQGTGDAGTIGWGNSNGPAIGMYGSATGSAGAFVLKTAGVERVRLNGAGRLLVGTATDDGANLMQVNGNVSLVGAGPKITFNAAGPFVNSPSANVLALSNGSAEVFRLSAGGRLLVGTTTDDGANVLQVAGAAKVSGVLTATAGGTFSAAAFVDMVSTATTAQLSLKGSSGALSTESKLRFYGTFGTGSDLGTRLVASMRAGFNAGTWGKEYLDFYLNSASNDAQSDANQSRVLRLAYGGRVIVGTNAVDDGVNRLQVSGNVALSGAMKVGTYTQQVEINGDSYTAVNAYYDGTNWQRIDTTKPAWLFQSNVTNDMTFEGYKGLSWWVCQPGTNPIGNWGAANGWTLIQSYSQYHDVTLGGNGFEIDGNGTLPYGRFQHATVGGQKRTGVMTNAYIDESGRDDTTKNSWWFGVSDDGTASGDKWKIQRAASGTTFAWSDLITVTGAGRVLVGTSTDDGSNVLQVNGPTKITGALSVTGTSALGTVNMSGTLNMTGGAVEFGSTTAVMTPFIDFHSSGTGNDYDARIIASGGSATVGAGALTYVGSSGHYFTGNVTIQPPSSFAIITLKTGTYQPVIRSNAATASIEFVNSANSAVNLTVYDSGTVAARGQLVAPTVSATGGTSQFAGAAVNGTLWIQNQNQIALQGTTYTAYLRGDNQGLCGFINQAGSNWNFQIWDDGRTVHRGLATFNGNVAQSYQNFGYLNFSGSAVNNAAGSWAVGVNVDQAVTANQFFALSDRRLKTEIKALDEAEAIRFVEQVEPKTYLKEGVRERGYLAQDVGKALDGSGCELLTVSERKGLAEEIDEDGFVSPEDHVLNVAHNQIIPIHSAVLRNLLRRVAELEAFRQAK